jgi:chemotaxis signal transduction protein
MEKNISQQKPLKSVAGNNSRKFLTFLLNNEIYGIDILSIKEITDFGNITRVLLREWLIFEVMLYQ